jgi:uncharacterized LabA/DUF88 family protein
VPHWPRVPGGRGFFYGQKMVKSTSKRVSFFIDGFNIYHALQDNKSFHKYKWLDFSSLAKCFVSSKDTIADIYYFTSFAEWEPDKKARHQLLIRALKMKGVKIIFGKFKLRDKKCRICRQTYQAYEEKQTDVNISVKLFQCAYQDSFDRGILITGDSDIIPAVKIVKETFPSKEIGLIIPIGRHAEEIKNECDFHMKLKEKHLKSSQFPDKIIIDAESNIYLERPPSWI